MRKVFFLSFDNMNLYKHRKNQHLYNKCYQVIYTTRYIYVIDYDSNY